MFTSKYSSESEQMLNISINFIAHLIRQIDKNIFELIYINECRTQKSKSDVKTHSTDTCQMSQCFTDNLLHWSMVPQYAGDVRCHVPVSHNVMRLGFVSSRPSQITANQLVGHVYRPVVHIKPLLK